MKTPFVISLFAFFFFATEVLTEHVKGITEREAQDFVNRFFAFRRADPANRDELARDVLTSDVRGYSSSTFSVRGEDPPALGVPFVVGRQNFSRATVSPGPNTRKTDLYVLIANGERPEQGDELDNVVVWKWRFDGAGRNVVPISGINIFEMERDQGKWKAKTVALEFDTFAWRRNFQPASKREEVEAGTGWRIEEDRSRI